MTREISKEDDDHSSTYDLTKYDRVYIILKDNSDNKRFSECIKYSKTKKKYYLVGKLVKLDVPNLGNNGITKYPFNGSVAFVEEKQLDDYKRLNHPRKKLDYIYNVFWGDIAHILADFDSFDWKKFL